jgi:3-deoxy-manno-octulosonate cytidylyltransferase (CMP-KDO synthetase)
MSLEKIAVVIPARMASTRLPGKVLKDIHGEPLIWRVYEGCMGSEFVKSEDVYVITPDREVLQAVRVRGGRTVHTGVAETVLARCSQVAELQSFGKYDLIVVVQGDEPMVHSAMIDLAIQKLNLSSVSCLVKEVEKGTDVVNPNMVKLVMNQRKQIVYFSRAPIPGLTPERHAGIERPPFYKQVCIMAFTRRMLARYKFWPLGPLERAEGIDQLRYLENGIGIQGIISDYETQAVDTQEDLEKVRELWNEDHSAGI